MNRKEIRAKIENLIRNNDFGAEEKELYNFQLHGVADYQVSEELDALKESCPEIDKLHEFHVEQAILRYDPDRSRIVAAAKCYASDYTLEDFLEENDGDLGSLNHIFPGLDADDHEIAGFFAKQSETCA